MSDSGPIQSLLATATIAGPGYQDQGVLQAYSRAEKLAERLNETEERFWAALGLHLHAVVVSDLARARELAERLFLIAEASGNPALLSIGWYCLGTYHYYAADFETALVEMDKSFELAPPEDVSYRTRTGVDLRVLALSMGAQTLWHLGYPERARNRGEQAIALARELGEPLTLVFARGLGGAGVACLLRDAERVHREAREVYEISSELGFGLWIWQSRLVLAWAHSRAPTGEAPPIGLADRESTRQMIESLGGVALDAFACLCAEILMLQGHPAEALRLVEQSLPLIDALRTPAWIGELYRLQGEILRSLAGGPEDRGDDDRVEGLFQRALEQARRCRSRGLELRAALSLAGFWWSREREAEAQELLAGVYNGFSEGFDTHDLRRARAFLEACPATEATWR